MSDARQQGGMWLEKLWYKAIKMVSGLGAGGFGLVGVVIVLQQIVKWLKYAIWEPYTIGNAVLDWGLPLPYTPNMLGVQKIIDEILSWPAIVAYILLTIGCFVVFVWADQQLANVKDSTAKGKS